MKRQIALTVVFLVSMTGWAVAGTLHVPGDYSQINDAVQACAAGDTVMVASGTYNDCTHPTGGAESTNACVIMKSGVTLIGAGISETTINALGLGVGIYINGVDNVKVQDLAITEAFADMYGAGILVNTVDSTVVLDGLRVHGNNDGGIVCINYAHPVISNCVIENNAAKQGGGIAIEEDSSPLVTYCSVLGNGAPSGAGIFIRSGCSPVIEFTTVDNNHITENWGNGGGISIQTSTPTIRDCTISNNSTMGHGGGVAFYQNAAGTLENSLIQNNSCTNEWGSGGGISTDASDPLITNCVVVGNSGTGAYTEGGGIDIQFSPSPTISNCTIIDNAGGSSAMGGGIAVQWSATPIIERCIIAGSTSGQGLYCISATPVVSCSDIFGNAGGDAVCGTDGGGNFSLDPGFCDLIGGLNPGGPCEAGNHPDGGCDGLNIGAVRSCGGSPAPDVPGQAINLGNMPNPFNPMTVIFFDLPQSGSAQLSIYTLDGRLVTTRTWDNLPQGRTQYQWNGTNLQGRASASGVYLYRVDSQGQSSTKRMSLIR
jgi:hypothetical protein